MHHSSPPLPAPKLPLIRRLLIVVLLGVGCCFAFRAATTSLQASSSPEFVWKNIEDLQPGDLVVAREEHGTEVSLRPVKDVYRRTSDHLRHLTFRDQSGQEQVFSTTDEHPFWSVTENSFVNAGSLPIGHQVTGPDGALQTLVQTQREDHPGGVPVFNFQVDDYHTYFVSAHGRRGPPVLVHNADSSYGDIVDLWKAPSSSRPQSQILDELENGFDPANYPGNGPYFATNRRTAEDFLRNYDNGLQQIRIPREQYDNLVRQSVIQPDPWLPGDSIHVPPDLLERFNEALKSGPSNILH